MPPKPSDRYATSIFWKEALEPTISSLDQTFEEIYLVAELDKYSMYIAFVRTSTKIRGDTRWICIIVTFRRGKATFTIDSSVDEAEMLSWDEGRLLLDKRPFILTHDGR